MWYLYVVECRDKSLYCGITTDVERRMHDHNYTRRGAKYTRSRRPVVLRFNMDFLDRSEASRAEYTFKKLRSVQKRKLLQDDSNLIDYLRASVCHKPNCD